MLWSTVAVAIPVGIIYGSFLASLITMIAGAVLTCIVVLPPWPMYLKHPVKFLSANSAEKKDEEKKDDQKKNE